MIIREANKFDIPKIVEVLKLSLGEQDLPLSETIWNYKHVDNPFGKSVVLVAEDDGLIIGVRAFMRWEWRHENKNFHAFRAVDTATHPGYQGKGIFKKLTLKAVEIAKINGDNFIFNTPNDQSRPGYLKMGWQQVDKISVALKIAINSFWKVKFGALDYNSTINCTSGEIDTLCKDWNENLSRKDALFTPKSAQFLSWRYECNPLQKYEVFAQEDLYVAGYIKKRKGLKELRISECIFNKNSESDIFKVVKKMSDKFGAQVISYSPKLFLLKHNLLNSNIGPVLTLKELNLSDTELSKFKHIPNWNYSLGDLELF